MKHSTVIVMPDGHPDVLPHGRLFGHLRYVPEGVTLPPMYREFQSEIERLTVPIAKENVHVCMDLVYYQAKYFGTKPSPGTYTIPAEFEVRDGVAHLKTETK